jgi:hypothetical protein
MEAGREIANCPSSGVFLKESKLKKKCDYIK